MREKVYSADKQVFRRMNMTKFSTFSRVALVAMSVAAVSMENTAHAATALGNFQVTATVVSSCNVSGSTLNFGSSIDPLSASVPLDATSTLTVQCTNTTLYSVALDAGSNAGGAANFGARAVKNGSRTLGYQLYTDTGRTTVWGNGTGSSTVAGTGSGSNQSLTIYGRLPSLAGAVPGGYTDTVTVTITY
jgi:spore coat protein U domain-containing protein, fimbrial subunit CupE1/2/3/6